MKTVTLPSGEQVPALGLGTWNIGDKPGARAEEIATIQMAIDLGVTLIDTAEMYGEGRSEELVGEALAGDANRRDRAFLVSKVYPHNATRSGAAQACERSLRRLGTDVIDLYLLHWRGNVPLEETLEGFTALQKVGKIRHYGVSNLDLSDMQEWWQLSGGHGIQDNQVQTNQLLYNLTRRGIEADLLPWLRERHVPVMAYSPLEQARLVKNRGVIEFARRAGLTPSQIALAWLLSNDDIIAIPKTASRLHLQENLAALDQPLSGEQLADLDRLFPPPKGPRPLEML